MTQPFTSTPTGNLKEDVNFQELSQRSIRSEGDTNQRIEGGLVVESSFEVDSTTGFLVLPRMTTAQRDAVASPVDGSLLYNTTTTQVEARVAGAWVAL